MIWDDLMTQDNFIINERVQILYSKAFASISTALIAALLFSVIFRDQIAQPVLMVWLSFMFIITLFRYWLLLDYRDNKEQFDNHESFENKFIYSTGLVGAGWAFFIFMGINLPVFEYHIYSLLLLVAIISIAAPIFSSSIKTVYAYIGSPLIVTIPYLLLQGGDDIALGLALIVFAIVVIRSSNSIYNTLIENFISRFQAQELAENLTQLRHEKSSAEERMQGIMDYSPAAIYLKDIDGHFIFLNKKVADLHQMSRIEMIGKTLHDILPKETADEMRRNDIEVISLEKPIKYEENTPQKDGLHHYISIKFPLFDKDGVVNAIGGVSTDITERFRIEESLRISQQRLLLHRDQSPLGLIEWNTDFEFVDWNPAAERIFGYTREEVLGHHVTSKILPESSRQAVDKIWNELLENKGRTYSVNENITKNGQIILCEWHNTALIDQDGNVIGVSSLVDDVTEREQNEVTLRQSQKMDAIGKLTGGIAHDFNNMLGVILGFSELLKDQLDTDDIQKIKYCDEILNAGERAKKLTSKLQDFSRKTPSLTETVELNKVLESMQHMLEKTLTHRIKLNFEFAEDLWDILLDKSRLEDAVLNICINSMHAMPDGGSLTLRTTNISLSHLDRGSVGIKPGDYVLLTISDTGVGMSDDVQQKIFEPFFTTKGTDGMGLGMSQVYGFIQQSGGNIEVFSGLDKGTRIALYIPRQSENEIVISEGHNHDSVELPSGHEVILVVDDEIALLDLTKEILSSHGYHVLRAQSAESALEILENTSVDLIVSDVIMPGMDGYSLANEVEKLYPNIKIQIISGYSDEHNKNLMNDKLHQQRIEKPFSAEQLLVRVRYLLDGGI